MTDTFTFATDSQTVVPRPDDTVAIDAQTVVPGPDDTYAPDAPAVCPECVLREMGVSLDEDEVRRNPRARSAKLRAAERVA